MKRGNYYVCRKWNGEGMEKGGEMKEHYIYMLKFIQSPLFCIIIVVYYWILNGTQDIMIDIKDYKLLLNSLRVIE